MAQIPLPQAGNLKPPLRKSRRGRWRAAVLIFVHLLFAIHLAHWWTTGKTITPVEPSESMQTLELGLLNAGFIFFALLIASTLIFGRFFCGWACHVVALQDLCSVMLDKLHIKPKSFRSRLLVLVPLFAALYMFAWPTLARILAGGAAPSLVYHFQTENFWATFPGPIVTILTFLICGFAVVYFLGNKGFCTYGCPYGAIFGLADRVAPGRIRVTDACDQCGHCTATCSSNVRVHEEVNLHGMVVNPGCLKCLDCIDVCPKQALYFGFKPAVSKKSPRPTRTFDLSLPEEIVLAVGFVISFYAFRGLYDQIPFLLSLGLSGISAYWFLLTFQVVRRPHVRLQRWQLKSNGRVTRSGSTYIVLMALWFIAVSHCFYIQYQTHQGNAVLAQARAIMDDPSQDPAKAQLLSHGALDHLMNAYLQGLMHPPGLITSIASIHAYLDQFALAEDKFREALASDPNFQPAREGLANVLKAQGKWQSALDQYLKLGSGKYPLAIADCYAGLGRWGMAQGYYQAALIKIPNNPEIELRLKIVGLEMGLLVDGNEAFRQAELLRRQHPLDETVVATWAKIAIVSKNEAKAKKGLVDKPLDDADAWYAIAMIYHLKHDSMSAEAIMRRLSASHPQIRLP